MKQTHKFKELGDIAAVVAKASSLSAAAKALGVDRSTLHRWMEAGKLKRPRSKPPMRRGETRVEAEAVRSETPKSWADRVKAEYVLSPTEQELLQMAADALVMAKTSEHARDRLTAMARFQQLVRQLNLDAAGERGAEPQQPVVAPRAIARRAGGDPRSALMAVK